MNSLRWRFLMASLLVALCGSTVDRASGMAGASHGVPAAYSWLCLGDLAHQTTTWPEMGIPHVVLDNNNGKLSSFRDTWTKRCELTVWADAPEEALQQAHLLARPSISAPRGTPWATELV